jgi:hypothetical protein
MAWAGPLAALAMSGADLMPRAGWRPETWAARLREEMPELFDRHLSIFRSPASVAETSIARLGPIEIRRTDAGWVAETRVKGEPGAARITGRRRLEAFVSGDNTSLTRLRAIRPLTQAEDSPGRWRLRVHLRRVEGAFIAAAPRTGKVRIREVDPETFAVLRLTGRPTLVAIARGADVIRAAIDGTSWMAAGGPILRLDRAPSVLPFFGGFEVAIPVEVRMCGRSAAPGPDR